MSKQHLKLYEIYLKYKLFRVWKEMSLDNTISEYERSKLAVWDYPVSDKFTKVSEI